MWSYSISGQATSAINPDRSLLGNRIVNVGPYRWMEGTYHYVFKEE